jgi:phosphocarrier protein
MTHSADLEIVNVRGLHARAAARFCDLADRFDADITVCRENMRVGGCSLMALLMLGAGKGSVITVTAEGREAEAAIAALGELVRSGFGEDD